MSYRILHLFVLVYISSFTSCKGQKTFGENYLQVSKIVSLPNVRGRIDHLDINLKDQLVYVAALGNNTLEVVDLESGKVVHSIKGLDEPQGVCYIPVQHEIFVANGGSGDCFFFSADTYEKVAKIHVGADADDVRYDSLQRKIYVGYGSGGIAIIDAVTHKQTSVVKLPAHPEGFQIDKKNNLLFVNVPNADMISVIDLKNLKVINKWTRTTPTGNFPMALNAAADKIFIGYRHPAKLIVLDTKTGKQLSIADMANDTDDLFYDDNSKRVYVSCGGGYTRLGYVNMFEMQSSGASKQIANIPTRNGARTSLLIPQLDLFVVAEPSVFTHDGELLVYKITK